MATAELLTKLAKADSPSSWRHSRRLEIACVVLLAGYGIFLRVFQYVSNYSLHMDECLLALNLLNRNFDGLRQALAYKQVGPIGFLYGEKLAMLSAGNGPLVMRFLPFAASVLGVVVFYLLARRFFSGLPLVVALALFSANQAMIFYAATIKQYSLEALIAIVLVFAILPLLDESPSRRTHVIATIAAVLMWFSFSSVFVLTGIGAVLVAHVSRKNRKEFSKLTLMFLGWLAIFLPFYWYSIRPSASIPQMVSDWTADYMPLHPVALVHWLGPHFAELWAAATTWRIWPLAAVFFIVGVWHVLRSRSSQGLAVLSALVMCLAAAGLKKYPFALRLQLFLVPSTILLIAAGYHELLRIPKLRYLAHGCGVVLAAWCCLSAGRTVLVQRSHLDSPREVVQYVRDHWQPGDRVYVDGVATAPFLYYNRDGRIHDYTLNYSGAPVTAGRAWFLYFRSPWKSQPEYLPAFTYLQEHGTEVAHFDAELHSVALFVVGQKSASSDRSPTVKPGVDSAQKETGPPPDGPSTQKKS